MNQRYLIINADDYGIRPSANRAITRLFSEKRITSSTIMAPAGYAGEAVTLAKNNSFPIGVHWTVNSDWKEDCWHSVAPKDVVASFTDDGLLYPDTSRFAKEAKSNELAIELEAQINYLTANGCRPDHADSHCGTLYGINGRLFFINAFRLCRKYGLPFRFPKSKRFLSNHFSGKVPGMVTAAHSAVVLLAKLMGVSLLDDMLTNPDSVEALGSYEALRDYYLKAVSETGPGITELFLHPSEPDEYCFKLSKEWQKRVWEYEFLLKDDLFDLINKENIKLVSWKDAPFRK